MLASFARMPAGFNLLRRQVSRTHTSTRFLHSKLATSKESDIDSFDLNYWIFGDDPSREPLPTLRIGKRMTVSTLKAAIMEKEQHLLPGIPAKSLEIWKVSIAVESLKVKLADFKLKDNLRDGVEKLAPQRRLGRAFPDPCVDSILHIVVRPPDYFNRSPDPVKRTPHHGRKPDLHFLDGSQTIYQVEGPDETCLPGNDSFSNLITTPNIIAADKTHFIERIDRNSKYQYMFLRPPGWGKTTFLQMLADYYDKTKADEFMDMFGQLYIGRNPTRDRSTLLVMLFDFSGIPTFSFSEMKTQFHKHINSVLRLFLKKNARFLGNPDPRTLIDEDSISSLKDILLLVHSMGEKLFIGVDEFDSPANMCLFEDRSNYIQVAQWLKALFFTTMKSACYTVLDKYWLTGVLPMFRDGMSPLSVIPIWRSPRYNESCGLTEDEVMTIANNYLSKHSEDYRATVTRDMKLLYSGYRFCSPGHGSSTTLYNPRSVFAHLDALQDELGLGDDQRPLHSTNVLKPVSTHGDVTVDDFVPLLSGGLRTRIATAFGPDEFIKLATGQTSHGACYIIMGLSRRVINAVRSNSPIAARKFLLSTDCKNVPTQNS